MDAIFYTVLDIVKEVKQSDFIDFKKLRSASYTQPLLVLIAESYKKEEKNKPQ